MHTHRSSWGERESEKREEITQNTHTYMGFRLASHATPHTHTHTHTLHAKAGAEVFFVARVPRRLAVVGARAGGRVVVGG